MTANGGRRTADLPGTEDREPDIMDGYPGCLMRVLDLFAHGNLGETANSCPNLLKQRSSQSPPSSPV